MKVPLPIQLSAILEAANYLRSEDGFETTEVLVGHALFNILQGRFERSSGTMASLLWVRVPARLTFMGLPISLHPFVLDGQAILEGADGTQHLITLEDFELRVIESRIEHKILTRERLTRYEWLVAREKPAVEAPETVQEPLEGPTRYTQLSQEEQPPEAPLGPKKSQGFVKGLLSKFSTGWGQPV